MAKQWLLEHILYEDMKVEKYRKSALSLDDGSDVSFEEEYQESNEQAQYYLYVCNCKGKIHDVPYGVHQKIEITSAKFTCKTCKQAIKFYKKHA